MHNTKILAYIINSTPGELKPMTMVSNILITAIFFVENDNEIK